MQAEGYQVRTESFEGPLDLLLYLIRKKKMNIMDVRISEITAEYLLYLEDRRGINPSREGDFLMTASTLIYIKSRSLLPRPDSVAEDSEESRLLHSLVEYDKVQKIARLLQEKEEGQLVLWRRQDAAENFETREYELEEVSSFQLAELFLNLVKRSERERVFYITSKNYSIEEKRAEILGMLDRDGFIDFVTYVGGLDSIEEVLVSFFTLLELIKLRLVVAVQKRLFDSISVWKQPQTEKPGNHGH
ncbi:MAG: segregation/condensation protein A [Acidobacteriota bacterium]|jgi:segregation and condensation protein A|nr:segregation/condensation protein A [Acidobacteriota bacterium]